jgi:hypothetical protein
VAVDPVCDPPHLTSSNMTNARPIICCNSFLLLIVPLLSPAVASDFG